MSRDTLYTTRYLPKTHDWRQEGNHIGAWQIIWPTKWIYGSGDTCQKLIRGRVLTFFPSEFQLKTLDLRKKSEVRITYIISKKKKKKWWFTNFMFFITSLLRQSCACLRCDVTGWCFGWAEMKWDDFLMTNCVGVWVFPHGLMTAKTGSENNQHLHIFF